MRRRFHAHVTKPSNKKRAVSQRRVICVTNRDEMEDEVEYTKRRSKRNRKRCIIGLAILLVILLIIAIIVVVTLVVSPLFRDRNESGAFRLPTSVVPDQYVLELQPYLIPGNFTFDGSVNITVRCRTSTYNVTLHSSDLNIHEATIKDVTEGSNIRVKSIENVSKYELLILHLKDKLKARNIYQLRFKFSGTLGTSNGLYWRSYIENGNEKYIAATKFKPTFARRAFPCFDEPSYKASFAINIVRQGDFASLSSGEKKNTKTREDGWQVDMYLPSIKMSTYHVAIFVGQYTDIRIRKDVESQIKVSIIARGEKINPSHFALDAAQMASEFYVSKFRDPIYITNIDFVEIPNEIDVDTEKKKSNDFDVMGQESTSWRLVMMDESSMITSTLDREWKTQEVARKVAHQVAHQLFGTLVTPKWWSEIWLSESIATYLDILAADQINPKWKTLEALKRSGSYVEFDCSESSRPLSMAVNEPSDISKQFNLALYRKGARLLDMVYGLLTEKLFWDGLSNLLQAKGFNITESNDLWRHLTEAQRNGQKRIDFEVVMSSWIHYRGHPIVTLERNYNKKTAFLSQKSCLNESTIWNIPITILEQRKLKSEEEIFWLDSINKTVAMPKADDWVLLNGKLNGLFHVNYDKKNWKMLAQQLLDDHLVFSASTRYQLFYDALILARMSTLSYDILLELIKYMKYEMDISVKEFLAEAKLSEIGKMLRMSNVDSKWKDYLRSIVGNTYRNLFKSTSGNEELLPRIYLKREIATCACYYDDQSCVDDATSKSNTWLKDKNPFNNTSLEDYYLIRPYLCTAARKRNNITDKIHDILKSKSKSYDYLENKTETEDMIYALGCSKDSDRSSVYMEKFIIEDGNPKNLIESMLNSHDGSVHLFNYLESNINRLREKYYRTGNIDRTFNNLRYDRLELVVKTLSEAIANPIEFQKMSKVFDKFIEEMKKEDNRQNTEKISKMLHSYTKMAEKRLEFVKYHLQSLVLWLGQ